MPEGPVRPRAITALIIGVVLVTMFSFFFVFPGHDPKPNDLPIVVAGPAAAVAPIEQALRQRGEAFEVKRFGSEQRARQEMLDREAYGAILPAQRTTLTSSAASVQVQQIVAEAGRAAGATRVVDIKPLDRDDPRGTSINLTVLPITVTAILGALLLFSLAPDLDPRGRIALLALFALLGGLASMLVVRAGIGALPGSFLALAGVTALTILAVSLPSAALMQLLGSPGIGLSFVLFLMLGNPGSGAAAAPELLPDPWAFGGQLLPPGAAASGIRNTAYFDAARAEHWLAVLILFALGGVLLLLARRRSPSPLAAPSS